MGKTFPFPLPIVFARVWGSNNHAWVGHTSPNVGATLFGIDSDGVTQNIASSSSSGNMNIGPGSETGSTTAGFKTYYVHFSHSSNDELYLAELRFFYRDLSS